MTLRVAEPDTLRRVALLNSALFRVLAVSKLKRVAKADYANGEIELIVWAEHGTPELVPGEVSITVREKDSS